MDIKASNIFISAADGRWYLGDFGSSKRVGEVITSSNLHAHSNVAIVGQKAHPKYDWLMLLLVLLRESLPRKVSWMTAFCNEHDKLDAGRIISFIGSLDDAGFVGLADVISQDRCEDLLTI